MKEKRRTEKKVNAVYRAVLSVGKISEGEAADVANFILERCGNDLSRSLADARNPFWIDGHPTW